jgi:hypothetical protein
MGLRATTKEKTFRDTFCEHFWITTSGFFSDYRAHVQHDGDGY